MRRIILIAVMIVLGGCTIDLSRLLTVNMNTTSMTVLQGDATRGADIFTHGVNDAPPCIGCHSLGQSAFSLGPKMTGISQRAAERVPGMNTDAYLRQSILEPSAYVVSGFRDIMYPNFKEKLTEQDIVDLIAYLETL
ncbi:MAG: c-type cytochrome [Anaerolineaceae bacterium]|nr:c-type cytochrome [Anaerolineaceae bacterium]